MSQSNGLIGIFPVKMNQGSYYFRHMGEFEILKSIEEGDFSEVFLAKSKNANEFGSSNTFKYVIKIYKKFIISNDDSQN